MKWWMASVGVAAIVCVVTPQVQAEEVVVKDVRYELFTAANGKKEARATRISKYNGDGSYVELVESVNGVPVTEIAPGAFKYDYTDAQEGDMISIQMKALPASVVRIGDEAFWDVTFDGHITLGTPVEAIGERAFEKAKFNGLTIATAPDHIEEGAFSSIYVWNTIDVQTALTREQLYLAETPKSIVNFPAKGMNGERAGDLYYETFTHNGQREVRINSYDFTKNVDELTIPETIDGAPVTEIAAYAFQLSPFISWTGEQYGQPKRVHMPKTIRKVGDYAFDGMSDNAFDMSDYPNLQHIGNSAFRNNRATNVTVTPSMTIGKDAFLNTGLTEVVIERGVTHVPGAFAENSIADVTIPDSVTTIGDEAFANNQLTAVHMPSSLVNIGNSAFLDNALTAFDVPSSVTSIGNYAFAGNALTTLTIPNNVTHIGVSAFARNTLTSVKLPTNLTKLENGVFSSNQLSSIDIPETVTSIGNYALSGNQLSSIDIPATVTSIGNYALSGNQLTSAHVSGNVQLGTYAYTNNQISNVTFHGDVKSIPAGLFEKNRLVHVTLPDSIETIGDYAFNLNEIQSVHLPTELREVGRYAFAENDLAELIIPPHLDVYGEQAFGVNPLQHVEFAKGRTHIPAYFMEAAQIPNVTIAEGVTHIGDGAFTSNKITSVTLPNSVVSIGDDAFSRNQLTTVTLPNELTTLGNYAFANNQLQDVTLPSKLKDIGDGVFNKNALRTVTLPNEVTTLGKYAFANNQLQSVTILSKLKVIEERAFMNNAIETLTLPYELQTIGEEAFYRNSLKRLVLPSNVQAVGIHAFASNKIESVTVPASLKTFELSTVKTNPVKQLILQGSDTVVTHQYKFLNDANAEWKGLYTDAALTVPFALNKKNGKPMTLYVAFTDTKPGENEPPAKFKDIAGHWAQGAIESFTSLGYINGYPDGTFKPGAPIQRKHVARILNDVFTFNATQTVADFKDVPKSHPYYAAISAVQQAGIFSGNNGEFQPEANLTRGQLAKVLVLAAGFEPGGKTTFADTPDTYWGTPYVSTLADLAIVKGTDGLFNPHNPITRAQFVSMTSLALAEMERRAQQ